MAATAALTRRPCFSPVSCNFFPTSCYENVCFILRCLSNCPTTNERSLAFLVTPPVSWFRNSSKTTHDHPCDVAAVWKQVKDDFQLLPTPYLPDCDVEGTVKLL
eukprot:1916148-Rhodomonas_salina.2